MAKIACVYIGATPLRLAQGHGPYLDGSGARLKSRDLAFGSTIMMSEEEVNGVTFLHDPAGVLDSEKLGPGRMIKAEHGGLETEALLALGYDWHEGRADFVTVEQYEEMRRAEAAKQATASDAAATPAKSGKAAKADGGAS